MWQRGHTGPVGKHIDLCTVVLVALSTGRTFSQVASFYPYGTSVGDDLHPASDDACSLDYHHDISLFGVGYSILYVCTNGIVSLNGSYTSFTPSSFPLHTGVGIIATFWADADLRLGGSLWARETTNADLLHNVSNSISTAYRTSFAATWALVVTWEDVIAYGRLASDGINSYQCIIAADDNRITYVQYLYGDIEWTFGTASSGVPAQVGFDAGDGINFYAVPGSQTSNISDIGLDSNVGEAGQWMFRLDSATVIIPDLNATFPPEPTTTTAITTTTETTSTSTATSTTTTTTTTTTTAPSTTTTDLITTTSPTTTTTATTQTTGTHITTTIPEQTTTISSVQTTTTFTAASRSTRTATTTAEPETIPDTSTSSAITSASSSTTDVAGLGGGDFAAQGSDVTDQPGISQQQATIGGSAAALLFILLAVLGLFFALRKWKKKQIEDLWYDEENQDHSDEYTSQPPIFHIWPSDLNYLVEVAKLNKVEPLFITPKTHPAKEILTPHSDPENTDECVGYAPMHHIWPTELATVIEVLPVNSSDTPKTGAPHDALGHSADQDNQQKKQKDVYATDPKQQIDAYAGGINVPKAPKKPQYSLPPLKKTSQSDGERNRNKVAAKTFKQASGLYGPTKKRKK